MKTRMMNATKGIEVFCENKKNNKNGLVMS